jgi:hypothetical protein
MTSITPSPRRCIKPMHELCIFCQQAGSAPRQIPNLCLSWSPLGNQIIKFCILSSVCPLLVCLVLLPFSSNALMFQPSLRSSIFPLRVPQTFSRCASQLRSVSDLSRSTPRGRPKKPPQQIPEGTVGHVSARTTTPSAEQLLQWMEPMDTPGTSSEGKRIPIRKEQDGPERIDLVWHKKGAGLGGVKPPRKPHKPRKTVATDQTSGKPSRRRTQPRDNEYLLSNKGKDWTESGPSHEIPPNAPRPAVIKELKKAYNKSRSGKGIGDVRRVHVVSNELCGR